MDFENSVDLLNQLLVIHYRSLPMYLTDATPWTHHGDEKAVEVLTDIVADNRSTCQKLAQAVQQRGGILVEGEYPTEFTGMNFLSLDYLLSQSIKLQQGDIQTIEAIAERLWNDPPAQALAKEALGAAKGHLQSLQELVGELSGTA